MLILSHAGITLGAAALLAGAVNNRHSSWKTWLSRPLSSLSKYTDIRFVVIRSLLPDIIDKPVGQYIFRETFGNGRIFSHTLIFLVLISAAGLYLYQKRHIVWLLTLAVGTFVHLVLDEMWLVPETLFWPFMGFTFPRIEYEVWLSNMFKGLISNPAVYVPEIIGLIILLWFGLALVVRKKVMLFIKYGVTD